jgi:hypothetical protein
VPSAQDVAAWMLDRLTRDRYLDQETAAGEIARTHGKEFVYVNQNGNLAIDRKVLSAFRKLTPQSVVWERGERMWRFREDYDAPGRQTD